MRKWFNKADWSKFEAASSYDISDFKYAKNFKKQNKLFYVKKCTRVA